MQNVQNINDNSYLYFVPFVGHMKRIQTSATNIVENLTNRVINLENYEMDRQDRLHWVTGSIFSTIFVVPYFPDSVQNLHNDFQWLTLGLTLLDIASYVCAARTRQLPL